MCFKQGLLGAAYDPDGQLLFEANGDGRVIIKHRNADGDWVEYTTIEHVCFSDQSTG
jgi:hypothetical protein